MPISIYHSLRVLLGNVNFSGDAKNAIPVIVSLTSIPSRLTIVHLTIRSILLQSRSPKKIVLWLHEDLKSQLPKSLSKLCNGIFEIRYSNMTCSHRKLVHALEAFKNEIIITCDDDMIYHKDWLEQLYDAHKRHPDKIIANQTRCISYDSDGQLMPYKAWPSNLKVCQNEHATLPIGAGGTMYPPNSLFHDVTNSELFLGLTPKADDLWFKAMSLKKGTLSIQSRAKEKEPIPIFGSQKESLKKTNISEDKNRIQWQALADHYNLHQKLIAKSD